jgi:hypothetical protein
MVADLKSAGTGAQPVGEIAIPIDNGRTLVISVRIVYGEVAVSTLREKAADFPATRPLPKWGAYGVWREERILKVLQQLGHAPTALAPLPGGTRDAARHQVYARLLDEDGAGMWSARRFDKCWQALRSAGRIADAGKSRSPVRPSLRRVTAKTGK